MPRTHRDTHQTWPDRTSTSRLVVIDALRFVAVLLVLGRHIMPPVSEPSAVLNMVFGAWRSFGWIGVDLFFVLSGFLVSGLLFTEHQRHGGVRPWHFLARRGFKIYPGFYALLLVSGLWFGSRIPTEVFVREALFVQNYLRPTVWNHTWSLAVEEHFYIALSFALWLATRGRRGADALRGLPTVVATVCVVVLAFRIVAWVRHPSGHLLFPTHLRIDALAFGTGLAYAWHYHRERLLAWIARHRPRLAIVTLLLLVPSIAMRVEDSLVVNTVGLTTNYLAFGALLLLSLTSDRASGSAVVRGVGALGVSSYSIYLWHMPVAKAVQWWVKPTVGHVLAVAVYVVGSVVFGIVMAKLIERPFLRLRERWVPSRPAHGRQNPVQPAPLPPADSDIAATALSPEPDGVAEFVESGR